MKSFEVARREIETAVVTVGLQRINEGIRKVLDASPCVYRGCDMFAWCETCKGWRDGCTARLPEALRKNPNGTWRDEDP